MVMKHRPKPTPQDYMSLDVKPYKDEPGSFYIQYRTFYAAGRIRSTKGIVLLFKNVQHAMLYARILRPDIRPTLPPKAAENPGLQHSLQS